MISLSEYIECSLKFKGRLLWNGRSQGLALLQKVSVFIKQHTNTFGISEVLKPTILTDFTRAYVLW